MPIQNVSFQTPDQYGAQQVAIDRQRKLAEALQMQGQQPLETNQSAGGWTIPISPFQGLAKLAQTYTGVLGTKKANEREQELADKYRSDLSQALVNAQQAAGPHQEPVDTSQQGTGSMDMSGSNGPPTQTVPGSREKMIQALMMHPATQPLALSQMNQDLQMQGFLGAGGLQASQGNPMVAGGSGSSVMAGSGSAAPAGVPPQAFGGPAGGSPMAVWLRSDTTGKTYLEALQKDYIERQKPMVDRGFGIKTYNPATGKYDLASNPADITTIEEAKQKGQQPYSMQTMKIPVYLPGGDQIMVELNPRQAEQYNRTGNLPPEIGGSIPGYRPTSPASPDPASPAGFPKETPAERQAATARSLDVLQAERAQQLKTTGTVDPSLDREIARAGGQAQPVVGRSQTQEEQIRQTRQTAAGKAVDEAFGKDYVAFKTGGAQDATKQLAQLQDVQNQLRAPKSPLTGPFMGSVPDAALKFTQTGRNAIAMRERVEEVVQRSLRAILGAQFTEKEGERLIARAYNPNLSEPENAIRVGRLLTQLQGAYKAKADAADYFEKNSTLSGWQGKLPALSDFDPDTSGNLVKDVVNSGSNDTEALVKKWLR